MTYRIVVVVGSLRRESWNKRLASALEKLAPADFTFERADIASLPLYNQDDDANQPEPTKKLKASIATAQGLLFVTPEYNRSIPGVLKNAIDHASRPYGDSAWGGKPAGIIGASTGAAATSMAQQHLRNVLAAVGVEVMTLPEAFVRVSDEYFAADGTIANDKDLRFAQKWVDKWAAWVRQQAG